jgi:hypothetical protein
MARNEMGGQVIENKQFREMADFAPPNDFNELRSPCETLHFALRNGSFCFCWVFRLVEAQNAMAAKSTAASRWRRESIGRTAYDRASIDLARP